MVTCEVTGAKLLPQETSQCTVTRKRVDLRLLGRSEVSGLPAMLREMRRCAVTRKLVLPSELEQCRLTGQWVLLGELESCAVTGTRARRDQMLQSNVSGRFVLPKRAIRSAISDRVGLPGEAVACAWLGKPILRDEAAGDRLTRMLVAKRLLNAAGELGPLRDLLDGRAALARDADDLILTFLSLGNGAFQGLKHARVLASPQGETVAVCGEISSLFGLRTRYVGFLMKNGERPAIIGRHVIGSRKTGTWTLEDQS
jgi:hypothetical protein